jgi:electron transport complex protein RnfG
MKNNLVKLGGILCLISAVAGGILAFTYSITKDKIAEAELKASMDPAVLESVIPGAVLFEDYDDQALVESIAADNEKFVSLQTAVDASGNELGTVVRTFSTVAGYGGDMELYVGFNPDGTISGLYVLAHSETSGLGSKTTEPEFQSQFIGRDGSTEITVTKSNAKDDEILALTGATRSSNSFTSAVNNAIDIYSKYLDK